MAFFDVPTDDELSPEVRQILEERRRLLGRESFSVVWKVMGRLPKIIEARWIAYQNLSHQCPFPWEAQSVAVMLISHAKRCQACFAGSRRELEKLGFDEAALDAICANPDALPLKERDRLFIRYALKIATESADLKPQDFRDMEAHGFSKDEIQEIIGFAAYWNMNVVFNEAAAAGLAEE